MKFFCFYILLLTVILGAKELGAQEVKAISKVYGIVSEPYIIPDDGQPDFKNVAYRFGWNKKSPYAIGVQFINSGYVDRTIKFAIEDLTLNQMIVLDSVHNAHFGSETVKANSYSVIWSGPVDNIKDSFLLRVWNSNGDKFDQAPVSILNALTQKPISTPAVIVADSSSNGNAVDSDVKLLAIPTAISTLTPVPTPTSKVIYLVLGDSWAAGDGKSANGIPMWALTYGGLNDWYPQIQLEHSIIPGGRPADWTQVLPKLLADYNKKGIPVGYAVLVTGNREFQERNSRDFPDCTKGATLSQGVSYSYAYQKDLSEAIGQIYTADPDIHLVVTTVADFSGGTGKGDINAIYGAYIQRLYEIQAKYPNMRIANIGLAMFNHPEYFCPLGDPEYMHPNDLGHAIMSLVILEQFANWPYQPSKK